MLLVSEESLLLQAAGREQTVLLRQLFRSLLRRLRAPRSPQHCQMCSRLKPLPGQLSLLAQALTTPRNPLAAVQLMTEALPAAQLR